MVKGCKLHAILLTFYYYCTVLSFHSTYFTNFLEDLTHTLHLFKLNELIHAGDSVVSAS